MGVSENGGTPRSSILIGFSIINHPFWGVSLFLETPICGYLFEKNLETNYYNLKKTTKRKQAINHPSNFHRDDHLHGIHKKLLNSLN